MSHLGFGYKKFQEFLHEAQPSYTFRIFILVAISYYLTYEGMVYTYTGHISQRMALNNNYFINVKKEQQLAKQMMTHAWISYEKFAFPSDLLDPNEKKPVNIYSEAESFLLTAIDSLDTLHLMGYRDKVAFVKTALADLRFDRNVKIPVASLSKRIIGGLLAIYGLEESPIFIMKVYEIVEALLPALNQNASPISYINLLTLQAWFYEPKLSDYATLQLEFDYLSQVSQTAEFDDIYLMLLRFHKKMNTIDSIDFDHLDDEANLPTKGIVKYLNMLITLYKSKKDLELISLISKTLQNISRKYLKRNEQGDLYFDSKGNQIIEQQVLSAYLVLRFSGCFYSICPILERLF
eukprot:NODE_66_length_25735_cov_0.318497.p10 type:complete len:350 gc:universal NODE_66_length_25735_cov_0.318497:17670-18719(+)